MRSRNGQAPVAIRRVDVLPDESWLALRMALWPEATREEHLVEMAKFVAEPERYVQFIAERGDGAVGMAEASLRHDYVNGTTSSPVAFLEGLFVLPEARRTGVARALVRAVEQWAQARGCPELASDSLLENEISLLVHKALGFQETERVVFFRKNLPRSP